MANTLEFDLDDNGRNFLDQYEKFANTELVPMLRRAEEQRKPAWYCMLSAMCETYEAVAEMSVVDARIEESRYATGRFANPRADRLSLMYSILEGYASGRLERYMETHEDTQLDEDIAEMSGIDSLAALDESVERIAQDDDAPVTPDEREQTIRDLVNAAHHPQFYFNELLQGIDRHSSYEEIKESAHSLGEHAPKCSPLIFDVLNHIERLYDGP